MQDDSDRQRVFERCVSTHADSLYRVAFRQTGNATLASELVQETYLNAWKNIHSLEDPERMRAWMFAILRNQYSKLLSRETKIKTAQADQEQINELAAPKPIAQSEQQTMIQNAIEQLDDKHRMPVLLVAMEGMTVDQAAEVLDLPRGTVLSRLHRGREKLKLTILRAQELEGGVS